LPDAAIQNLNVSLGDFVEHYRTVNGKRISPATLSTFLDGIYRWMQTNLMTI